MAPDLITPIPAIVRRIAMIFHINAPSIVTSKLIFFAITGIFVTHITTVIVSITNLCHADTVSIFASELCTVTNIDATGGCLVTSVSAIFCLVASFFSWDALSVVACELRLWVTTYQFVQTKRKLFIRFL